jgi:hypothetical protein
MRRSLPFLIVIFALNLYAQGKPDSSAVLQQILDRLDSLEKQNQELVKEVRTLRQQLQVSPPASQPPADAAAAAAKPKEQPSLDERLAVEEGRTAEQAQTKVEASHKFPIQLDGMLLFNAFANGKYYEAPYSNEYGVLTGPNTSGATFRQTLLGLRFQGPSLPGDGHINGSFMMDFWGGSSDPSSNWLRFRRGDISFDWNSRSISFRQDKPVISPYQPDSLAEVGVPPLAGAGNLWLWLPQVRYEERFRFSGSSGLTGQVAVMQTKETDATLPASFSSSLESARPALEGRFAYWRKFDDTRRFELGSGFHVSSTHVAASSVGSHIGTVDWLIIPGAHLRLSGMVFKGQDVAALGSLGNGFTIVSSGNVVPVHSVGGWAQMAIPITNRLTFNLFGGFEDDHAAKVIDSYTGRNLAYASNLMYHLGPNVVVSFEAMQMRPRLFSGEVQVQHHYDLAVGYLF